MPSPNSSSQESQSCPQGSLLGSEEPNLHGFCLKFAWVLGLSGKKKKKSLHEGSFCTRSSARDEPKKGQQERGGAGQGSSCLPRPPPVGVLGWKEAVLGVVTRPNLDLGCSLEILLRGLPEPVGCGGVMENHGEPEGDHKNIK